MAAEIGGFSVHIYDPVKIGGKFIRTYPAAAGYTHSINASIGFDSAEFSFQAKTDDVSEWMNAGIMRHAEVYGANGKVFEGFVDSVSIRFIGRNLEIGPAVNIANRVAVVYTPIYAGSTTQPPVKGGQTVTASADNTESQSIYGIFYRLVNAGECTDAQAVYIRDSYLEEMAYPQKSETLDISSAGETVITVKILGYGHLLAINPYANASTTDITYSAFISALIAAEPNSYISASTARISTNAGVITPFQDGTKNIFDLIKGVCSLGDSSNNRWIFGIYEDRTAYYYQIPATPKYGYRLSGGIMTLSLYPGADPVRPWEIRPGQFLKYLDFPVTEGRGSGDIRSDPQTVFIESVSFRAPFSVTINGGRVNTIAQKLARLGLGSR